MQTNSTTVDVPSEYQAQCPDPQTAAAAPSPEPLWQRLVMRPDFGSMVVQLRPHEHAQAAAATLEPVDRVLANESECRAAEHAVAAVEAWVVGTANLPAEHEVPREETVVSWIVEPDAAGPLEPLVPPGRGVMAGRESQEPARGVEIGRGAFYDTVRNRIATGLSALSIIAVGLYWLALSWSVVGPAGGRS